MPVVAALYVDTARGPYPSIAGVDAWGVDRDARLYDGPWPVVSHPPCGHWGRYAHRAHDDGRTGPIAVAQVRRWGGVLEHPRHSRLWAHCGMPRPGESPDASGGFTIEVFQRDWGHVADKATWLYIVGIEAGDVPGAPMPSPPKVAAYRKTSGRLSSPLERMAKSRRHLTPPDFAEWLVELASRCKAP